MTPHSAWKSISTVRISFRCPCHGADALQTDQQPTGKPSWALTDLINGILSQPKHTGWTTSPVWCVLQRMVMFSRHEMFHLQAKGQSCPAKHSGEVKQRLPKDAEGHKPRRSPDLLAVEGWILFQNGLASKTLQNHPPWFPSGFRIKTAAKISTTPGQMVLCCLRKLAIKVTGAI